MKEKKFEKGDRVRVRVVYPNDEPIITKGMIGTVVGCDDLSVLVKFDTVKLGHTGCKYYIANNLDWEPHDQSHWYVLEHQLVKVGERK